MAFRSGDWENAICHLDAWIVGDEDGKSYIEQQLTPDSNQFQKAIFLTGDPGVERLHGRGTGQTASAREPGWHRLPLSHQPPLLHVRAGSVARRAWRCICRSRRSSEYRNSANWEALHFAYDTKRYYALKVENSGPAMRCFIDGRLILEATDSEILKGKAGITATGPARFQDFRVQASDETIRDIESRIRARETELARLRAENPQPKLWKKFATPEFGAGRNVRFGDLDGDGQIDMLIAQNIPHVKGDGFDVISCLTAVNLDGKILVADRPARPAQWPAHQRHALPDSRYRWRWPKRGCAGQGFQVTDPRRQDRRGEAMGVDAGCACLERAAVPTGER